MSGTASPKDADPRGADETIALKQSLLSRLPAFEDLKAEDARMLAAAMGHHRFQDSETIIREGDAGDRVYILVDGSAEVTTIRNGHPARLSVLKPGQLFGELALLSLDERRQATVTAGPDAKALSFSYSLLKEIFGHDPFVQARLERSAEIKLTSKFLIQHTPFSILRPDEIDDLSGRLTHRRHDSGSVIVRQGTFGDRCYILYKGSVEVRLREGDRERRVTTLGKGALFGEAALLTNDKRQATVIALEQSESLALYRHDLIRIMENNLQLAQQIALRMRGYQRLKRAPDTELTEASNGGVMLVNKKKGTRLKLGEEARFLWNMIDGLRSMEDLTVACADKFRDSSGESVRNEVAALAAAGFVLDSSLPNDVQKLLDEAPNRHSGIYSFARRLYSMVVGQQTAAA